MKTFKMTINVRNQKEFNRLRTLALLAGVLDKNEIESYWNDTFDEYYPLNGALKNFKELVKSDANERYNIMDQDIYDWWYMYCYYEVMIYTNKTDRKNADRILSNSLDKALLKWKRAISNSTIVMLRYAMKDLADKVKENPPETIYRGERLRMHLQFLWQIEPDDRVCSVCRNLAGTTIDYIPLQMPHPNCRCSFTVFEWWTNDNGDIVADRRYDIEQDPYARGDEDDWGYSIKQGVVTSETKNGRKVTVFRVDTGKGFTKDTYYEKR